MSIILSSFNAVLPLFVIGLIGFGFNKIRGINASAIKQMNAFVFDVLYPLQFFYSIYTGGLGTGFGFSFLFAMIISSVISFGTAYLIAKRLSEDKSKQGILHQAFFRGNMVVFGLAIISSILTKEQQAFYLICMAPILIIQNAGMMLGIQVFENQSEFSFFNILKDSFLSPQIIAIFMGIAAVKTGIVVPSVINSVLSSLSNVATPLCLVLIGASLEFNKSKKDESGFLLLKSIIIKLMILPLIALVIIYIAKLSVVESLILIMMFASPPSLSLCVVSTQMKWDSAFASELLLFSTLTSLFTLTFWIYILQEFIV